MSRRVGFVAFAVLVSVATALLVHAWLTGLNGRRAALTSKQIAAPDVVRVLVVDRELPAGAVLQRGQLQWAAWPARSAAPYIIEGHNRASDLEGAVLRSRLTVGQPVSADQVARPGERGFLAAILAPGKSAVTVDVTPSSGMAGFIFPGDRVDLLLTMTTPSPANAPHRMSETILTNLRVVGTDQTLSDAPKSDRKDAVAPKTVTLEVTPKQAEVVALASASGVISLSLRSLSNGADQAPPIGVPTWDSDLTRSAPGPIAVSERSPSSPRAPAPRAVSVYRAGQTDLAAPALPPPERSHS